MIKNLSIKVLVENKVNREGLLGEHGMSLFIQCDGEKVLFDTGYREALDYNARELGVDLNEIEKIVLSHGHFDHTGGLMKMTIGNKKRRVYGHPDLFNEHYSVKGDKELSIGIPFSRTELEDKGLEFTLDRAPIEVCPGLITSGEIPRKIPLKGNNLKVKGKNGWEADPFLDDMCMMADTSWGYVLILGCTHSGLENTLAHAMSQAKGKAIRAVIGGMHLVKSDEREIERNIRLLRDAGIEYAFPNHCTGFNASCQIRSEYRDKFSEASVGNEYVFHPEGLEIIPCVI